MTLDQKNQISIMRKENYGLSAIFEAVNIPKTTVNKFLNENKGMEGYRVCSICGEEFSYIKRTQAKKFCPKKYHKKNYARTHKTKPTVNRI